MYMHMYSTLQKTSTKVPLTVTVLPQRTVQSTLGVPLKYCWVPLKYCWVPLKYCWVPLKYCWVPLKYHSVPSLVLLKNLGSTIGVPLKYCWVPLKYCWVPLKYHWVLRKYHWVPQATLAFTHVRVYTTYMYWQPVTYWQHTVMSAVQRAALFNKQLVI